ncbi:putative BURP domain-containing protein [Dioscorea sansibarensis]
MKHFLSVLALILITATATHAFTSQVYWHKMLPNSPMPRAILDLISSAADELGEEKTAGTAVNVGKGGVAVNTGKTGGGGTNVNVGHGGVGVNVKGKGNTQVGVGKGGVSVNTGHQGKPVVVKVKPGYSPFCYQYAATETQVHDDPNVALFFLEKDLSPGSKFDLRFTKKTSGSPLISRSQANAIPFSSNKLPEILTRFQLEPSSVTAEAMKKTLAECEEPAMDGESKLCATSMESMVEFSMTSLGTRDVQASSTTVKEKSTGDAEVKKTYSVAPAGVRALGGEKLVACHAQPYPYAVFYCHSTGKSKAYKVALEGNDGTKVEAVAVCHLDTAKWNPKHLAFQVLKVKAGSVPVCHFLPEDHVVWTVSK